MYRPTKEERSATDPHEAQTIRRLICKELQAMDAAELKKLLWKLQQKKR